VSAADGNKGRRSARVRFIEQFLKQPHGTKLTALLLGQVEGRRAIHRAQLRAAQRRSRHL